jgi:hypothetical protein
MAIPNQSRRPIRIGNVSAAVGDGLDQVYRMIKDGDVDAITGDYLAEFNIAWKAIEQKTQDPETSGYEPGFLDQLAYHDGDAARLLVEKRVKAVINGGALNPCGLASKVDEYLKSLGLSGLKIAWVEGDDLTDRLKDGSLLPLPHLDQDLSFEADKADILSANAYTGQEGIVLALQNGADIVICGRVTDDSPAMGLASWWHSWQPDNFDALAGALMAGHLTECGPYVTGGNFCGAKEIDKILDLGFPIAEINHDGTAIITKPEGTNGAVTVDTCKAQLLYEIQGINYLNPDVVAVLDDVRLEQVGKDRVRLTHVKGLKAPPTTKLAICVLGGYQAELSAFCVGLDIDFKFNQIKSGILSRLDPAKFTTISIERYGTAAPNPTTEAEATVQIRIFVQAKTPEPLQDFRRAIFYNGIGGFCGLHLHMDWRTMDPRLYVKYFPAVVPQSMVNCTVQFLGDSCVYPVDARPAKLFLSAVPPQPIHEAKLPVPKGDTVSRPLGDLVYARSGDKGSNANVGFWVRDARAWPWLRSYLSTDRIVQLLGNEWKPHFRVDRCEFEHLWAVHFVIKGILDEGVSSTPRLDSFAKSVGEFLRARYADLPRDLLQ